MAEGDRDRRDDARGTDVEPRSPEEQAQLTPQQVRTLQAFLGRIAPEEAGAVAETFQMMVHSGPLPTPDDLAGYEQALPGAAKTIMAMAEDEQRHRHELNRREQDRQDHALDLASRSTRLGQWIAAWLFTILVAGGVTGMLTHNQVGGFALLGTGLVGHIVNAFGVRYQSTKDRDT